MALETSEPAHDCCPPEIQLEAAECCTLDDVSVDTRSGTLKVDDQPEVVALVGAMPTHGLERTLAGDRPSIEPPGPPGNSPPLHKLFCVYLR